jgi:AcrR family transcriptional regulator
VKLMTQATLRSDAMANRQRLIDAAREMFAERGLGVEMKEIAERAGVGVGTIYRNFATKEDLMVAIVQELLDQADALIAEAESQPDATRALAMAVRAASRCADQYSGVVQALRSGSLPPAIEALKDNDGMHARVRGIFQRAIDEGVIRKGVTAEFLSAYFGALFIMYVELRDRVGPAEAASGASELFLRGILADPSIAQDLAVL